MLKTKLGFVLVAVGALAVGCGDKAASTSASAEPAKSGAAATGSAKADAPKAAAKTAAIGDVLKFMPKDCSAGRAYLGVKQLGAAAGDLSGLEGKLMESLAKSDKPDDKKATEVLAVFKEGGLDPAKDLQDLAMCMGANEKLVAALGVDFAKVADPAGLVAKAMEKGSGKAPTKEEADGVTYLSNDKGDVMAFAGGGIVLLGKDKESLKAILKGGDGASEFADAKSHMIWAKVTDKGQNVDVMIKEAGDNLEFKVAAALPGPQGEAFKKDPAGSIKGIETMTGEVATKLETGPLKAAVPLVKNAKFAYESDRLVVSSSLPKAAIGELVKTISETSMQDLSRAL